MVPARWRCGLRAVVQVRPRRVAAFLAAPGRGGHGVGRIWAGAPRSVQCWPVSRRGWCWFRACAAFLPQVLAGSESGPSDLCVGGHVPAWSGLFGALVAGAWLRLWLAPAGSGVGGSSSPTAVTPMCVAVLVVLWVIQWWCWRFFGRKPCTTSVGAGGGGGAFERRSPRWWRRREAPALYHHLKTLLWAKVQIRLRWVDRRRRL